MKLPSRLSSWLATGALLAAPVLAVAQVQVNVGVQLPGLVTVAPPAPRIERMPAPRSGHIWVPGRWQWSGGAYAWNQGYWERARPQQAYAPGRWVQADGGWRWTDGGWRPHAGGKKGPKSHGHDDGHHCPPGQAKKGRC